MVQPHLSIVQAVCGTAPPLYSSGIVWYSSIVQAVCGKGHLVFGILVGKGHLVFGILVGKGHLVFGHHTSW